MEIELKAVYTKNGNSGYKKGKSNRLRQLPCYPAPVLILF